MKKISLLLLSILVSMEVAFSQATVYVEAPPFDNSTSSNRAPNGTSAHAYMRACVLVLASELTGISPSTPITSFGFTVNSGTSVNNVTGNFNLYFENTSDVTYLKGTTFSTAITGMSSVYASVMTVPISAGSTSITVTLSSPFTYTGGGLYVAYDWASTGPFDLTAAIYRCNSFGLVNGAVTGASPTSAPATLGASSFRPCFLFGIANTYTNEIQVSGIEVPGRVPAILNSAHTIKAIIKNASNIVKTNIAVNLGVTGANPFTNLQTIASLNAGASTTVNFAAFNPQNVGANTVSVSLSSDQNNTNNSATYSQSVTCNEWAQNPATGNYTNSVGFAAGSGIIASTYLNPVSSTLTGMRCAISTNTPSAGNQIWGVLLNATGGIIATTNTITISTGILNTFQTLAFASPQALSPATTYYLGFAQPANTTAYYPAGSVTSSYVSTSQYVTTVLTGGALTPLLQNLGYFGIEAIFSHTANVSVVSTPSAICVGTCANLSAQGTTSYTWSTGSTGTSIAVCPSVSVTYSIIGTNTMGCSSAATVNLVVNQLPQVTASSNLSVICLGGTVSLSSSGASTYSWSTGPTTQTIIESPDTTQTYTVIGISAAGCSKSNTVNVTVNSFTPGISSSTAICKGEGVNLTATGGTVYSWNVNSPFATINVTPAITTVYSVTATGPNNCPGSNSATVTVNQNPVISASASRTLMCKNESNTLSVSGTSTYVWGTGSTNTLITITPTVNITMTYSVVGYNANGCKDTAFVTVKVNACSGIYENGDYAHEIGVFPNPGSGIVNISFKNLHQNTTVEVYSGLGVLVLKQKAATESLLLDLQQEAKGIYFVNILEEGRPVKSVKLVSE